MTMMKMPIFVWSVFVTVILIIISFSVLTATFGMLSLDRLLGMHIFTSDLGGNPIVQKWWAYMADIMDTNPDNSPVSIPLKEVFRMD